MFSNSCKPNNYKFTITPVYTLHYNDTILTMTIWSSTADNTKLWYVFQSSERNRFFLSIAQ